MNPSTEQEQPEQMEIPGTSASDDKAAAEKAARAEREVARRLKVEAERKRRDAVRAKAEEQADLFLKHLDDETLDEVKDVIDDIVYKRDVANEWRIFDLLAASVGDEIVYVDKVIYGEVVTRKAKILAIEDNAEPTDPLDEGEVWNPRAFRPTFLIDAKGKKKHLTILPTRVRQITKTVVP